MSCVLTMGVFALGVLVLCELVCVRTPNWVKLGYHVGRNFVIQQHFDKMNAQSEVSTE